MNELKLFVVVVLIVFYFGVNFIPSIPARRVMRLIMAIGFLSYELLRSDGNSGYQILHAAKSLS